MKPKKSWPDILLNIGFIAIVIGAIDPMEGSLLILPGSGLLALGTYLHKDDPAHARFRMIMFIFILIGVTSLWVISSLGGIGGESTLSFWWSFLWLPYLVGWTMSIWGPGSPRWVLWAGSVISLWYIAILVMVLRSNVTEMTSARLIVPIVLSLLGAITIAGSIWRFQQIKRLSI